MHFSYPDSAHIKRGWEFDLIFRTGRRSQGELVRLFFVHRDGEAAKVGVAVGRKVACSVERSRGKRVMREAFRRLLPWIEPGWWVVASMRERGLDAKARPVYIEMGRLLRRAGIMSAAWPGACWEVDAGEPTRKSYGGCGEGLSGISLPASGE